MQATDLLGREDRNPPNRLAVVNRIPVDEGLDLGTGERGLGEDFEGKLADAPDEDRSRILEGFSKLPIDRLEPRRRGFDIIFNRPTKG
jgi:hypothetical protein